MIHITTIITETTSMATKEQIFAAADALITEGKNPTLAAVRKQLGGGSYTDISEFMQIWRANQQSSTSPMREPAPPAIAERLSEFGSELWAMALELANGRLQAEREALQQARQETEEIRKETTSLADQLTSEIDSLKAEIQSLKDDLIQAHTEGEKIKASEQTYQTKLETANREIEGLKVEIVSQKESLVKSHKETENARVAEQACQARLEASIRETESLNAQVTEERREAKKSLETAAELKGRLGAFEEMAAAKTITPVTETVIATAASKKPSRVKQVSS